MASFQSAGKGLQPNIQSRAVAAHSYHLSRGHIAHSLTSQGLQPGFDTGSYRSGILKQGVNPGHRPGGKGHLAGNDFHTTGSAYDNNIIPQDLADHSNG